MTSIRKLPIFKKSNLQYIFKDNKDAQRRYWAVKYVAEGMSQLAASKKSKCSISTINKWLKKFEETGDINCFTGEKRGPRKPTKVTEQVVMTILKTKKENPDLGGESIYRIVKKRIYVSLRNVYRILRNFKEGEYDKLIVKYKGINIEEQKRMTGYGGSLLLAYYYDKFSIPKLFNELTLNKRASKLLMYYMHGKLLGFDRIHDMYHVQDPGLFFANGLKERPHQSAVHKALEELGKRFMKFQYKQLKLLQNNYLIDLSRISIDPHFIGYYGATKNVAKQWDAVRRFLHNGYRPLYTYDLTTGCCCYALWIKEYYKGYHRLEEIVKGVQKGLTEKNKIREVYLDREFYSFMDLRKLIEKYGIDFTIPARDSKKLERWLKKIDGRRCGYYKNSRGNKIKVGLLEIPKGAYASNYPYKLTLIGFEEKTEKRRRSFGYLSSIPISRYPPTVLGKLAKERWRQENYFKEVTHQQAHNLMPSNNDNQIKGHLALEILGHNVVQLLKRDLPAKSTLKRSELKAFRIKLFQKCAHIITNSSRVIIDFAEYFLEQRNIPSITKKYDRLHLNLFDDRRLCFNLKH